MQGLLELITMMLALNGFGVDANPKAPTADAVLEYASSDADVMVHVDLAAIGPRNYKVLVGLPDDPAVKASPELLAIAKEIKANVEGVKGMAKAVVGLDIVNDLSTLTVFVDIEPGKEPAPLAVVRGSIPSDLVKKIASVSGGKTGTIDGRDTLQLEPGVLMGTTKGGALVVGPTALVEARVDDDWKAPKRKKGTAWATIDKHLDAKPFAMLAVQLDGKVAEQLAKDAGDNFAGDLIGGHELAIVALHRDGFALHWKDRSKAGLDRVALLTDGTIELMRAAHVAPRGVAKMIIAALPSYAGVDKDLDAVIARKDDILKIVEEYTGDGKFKVDVKKDTKARTLTVRATGKSFSDVVPAALLVPFGAGAFVAMRGDSAAAAKPAAASPPAKTAPPPRKTVPPRKGGGIKAPAKKKQYRSCDGGDCP